MVAEGLQGGDGGDGHGGGLLVGQVRRHPRELVRSRRGVLGERGVARPEHRVAGLKRGNLLADGVDGSGELRAESGGLGSAQAVAGHADQVGQPGHDVPRAPVQAGRADAHEHLLITDRGQLRHPRG